MSSEAHVFIYLPLDTGPIKVSVSRRDEEGEQPYFSAAAFPVGEHASTGDKDQISGLIRALKFADRNTAAADKRTIEIRSATR